MSKRLREILDEMGAPVPAWLESTPRERRAEYKANLWELRNLSKNLLIDISILSILNKDNEAGWWISSIAEASGLSKGVVSRSVERLKKCGLCWTRKKRVKGRKATFVHPGQTQKSKPHNNEKNGASGDWTPEANPDYLSKNLDRPRGVNGLSVGYSAYTWGSSHPRRELWRGFEIEKMVANNTPRTSGGRE